MRVITVRGIGEPLSPIPNLLDDFVRLLPVQRFDLPWSAVYGPVGGDVMGESFRSAIEAGERMLVAEIRKEPCIVVGYSGGAELAGNVANYFWEHPNLVHVFLVSDPSAPPSRGRSGIRYDAERRSAAEASRKVTWVSNPDDVICSCPSDSPLRAIAETTEAFSLGDPRVLASDLLPKLRSGRIWRWLIGDPHRYEIAYRDACGYLGRDPRNPLNPGRCTHTDYRQWMNAAVPKARALMNIRSMNGSV